MRKDITVAGDTIVVEGVYTVQGHGAESKVSAETAHVFKVKEGRVISFQQYTDSKTLWDNYLQNKGGRMKESPQRKIGNFDVN